MKIHLEQSQVQKQILAPILQQSIEVLLLPVADLHRAIEQELEVNPLLEINEERSRENDSLDFEETKQSFENLRNEIEFASHDYNFYANSDDNDDEFVENQPVKNIETLEENLLHELKISFSNPVKLRIGELIIGNINEDGYLTIRLDEIAKILSLEDLSLIEEVLSTIQHFEPIGIAARDLRECLLIQAKAKLNNEENLVCKIIKHHLDDLSKKKFANIAKHLKVTPDSIKSASRFIATLDPKPARNHRPIRSSIYIKPDIFIIKTDENTYHVQVNREGIPFLRINPIYKAMLEKSHLTDNEKDFIYEKMKNALQFIKSIQQRGQTVKRIAELILEKQRSFFEKEEEYLVPMTLKDIALYLNRNESTISRAISNKYMSTPKGLLPMKFFFSQAIKNGNNNSSVSNRFLKEEVKNLIQSENKSSPLSDQDIVKIFEEKGTQVARRTITKYRKTLKILPTYLRKQ